MTTYRYRAATATGQLRTGVLESNSRADALERLKRLGLMPIEAVETAGKSSGETRIRTNSAMRQGIANALGELAVLLNAGLALDRALQVCVENITRPPALKGVFAKLRDKVRNGSALSRAMMDSDGVFPPMASAMAEAGEASGKLDESLGRLAETLDRAEALRQTIISSLVYPALLLVVATGVILVMLLFVVPQFEDLFSDTPGAKLPFMTQVVMGASHVVRSYGLIGALALVLGGVAFYRWLHRPHIRRAFHRRLLEVPALGKVIRNAETARFARTLGSLLDGGVALPTALGIAQRSIGNVHMSESIDRVTRGLKQGGGLSGPLAATGLFPPMALSFLRTGEETAQLGMMLNRLADVLDRDVRTAIQRMIAFMTPAITVLMGAVVATVIASIMSAILGFNDLALGP